MSFLAAIWTLAKPVRALDERSGRQLKARRVRPLPNAVEVEAPCRESPPPELRAGIEEFNAGLYFECHETLEELWMARAGPDRWLYQGILQIGVSLYHLRRRNWVGAVNLMERGLHLLSAYPDRCQGIEVSALRRSSEQILRYLISEGRPGVEEFDWKLAPKIGIVEYPTQTKGES